MLQIRLASFPLPVLTLHHGDPPPTSFTLHVAIVCEERTRIGGLRASWQVTLVKPIGASLLVCGEWGPPRILETAIAHLDEGDTWLEPGETIKTVVLKTPVRLPPTRSTDFEKIAHHLHLSVLAPPPAYGASETTLVATVPLESASGSRSILGLANLWSSVALWGSNSKDVEGNEEKTESKAISSQDNQSTSPLLASHRQELLVIAPSASEHSVVDLVRMIEVPGLGVLRHQLLSQFFRLGGLFIICLRLENLDPLATVYACRLYLEQCTETAKRGHVHVDEYLLHAWQSDAQKSYLWRGQEAPFGTSNAGDEQDNWLHLSAGPRLPSPAHGGWVTTTPLTTSELSDEDLSTTRHALVIEIEFSQRAKDALEGAHEGEMKRARRAIPIHIEDCTLTNDVLITPPYSRVDRSTPLDRSNLLSRYKPGTETRPFTMLRRRSIYRAGRLYTRRYKPCSVESIHDHQQQNSGLCMCFFQEAFRIPSSGQNLSDVLEVYHIESDEDCRIDLERERRQNEWRRENPEARLAIPGFIHAIFHTRCICQEGAMGPVGEGEGKERHLVTTTSEFLES